METLSTHSQYSIQRWTDNIQEKTEDWVAEEVPVAMTYNGITTAVMLVLPQDLKSFALGFSITEQIIEKPEDLFSIEVRYIEEAAEIRMEISEFRAGLLPKHERVIAGRTGCGLCGISSLENAIKVLPPVKVGNLTTAKAIHTALDSLLQHQPLQALTGGTHAAAWANHSGQLLYVLEDVGRHNALDKLIGRLMEQNIDIHSGFVIMSSRASFEIIQKIAIAGISTVVAISAPTGLAIRLAQEAHITLVGFARKNRHVVYSEPQRIVSEN